jgi:hypothetical protein
VDEDANARRIEASIADLGGDGNGDAGLVHLRPRSW